MDVINRLRILSLAEHGYYPWQSRDNITEQRYYHRIMDIIPGKDIITGLWILLLAEILSPNYGYYSWQRYYHQIMDIIPGRAEILSVTGDTTTKLKILFLEEQGYYHGQIRVIITERRYYHRAGILFVAEILSRVDHYHRAGVLSVAGDTTTRLRILFVEEQGYYHGQIRVIIGSRDIISRLRMLFIAKILLLD